MSLLEIDPDFVKKLDEIIALAIQNGGLMAIGSNQCGKTNAIMWVLRRIIENPKHISGEFKTEIFDDCLNWQFKFDPIPYINYMNKTMLTTDPQDLIVDLHDIDDPLELRDIISGLIHEDFIHKKVIKQQLNGNVPFTNFYIVEEIQNIFGRNSLTQKNGRFIYKTVCECTNFGMCIIGLGQRLADIDARIVERRRYYLLGRANGENDTKKIANMFGNSVAEKVKELKVIPDKGITELVFFDKQDNHAYILTFPKFIQSGKPYPYAPKDGKLGSVKQLW